PIEFNHIVAATTIDGERVYLDATLSVAAFGVLAPPLRGKTGLLVDKDGARLLKIPGASPLQQFVHASATGSITATGSIELDTRVELRGDLELFYRQAFHETSQDVVRALTEAM